MRERRRQRSDVNGLDRDLKRNRNRVLAVGGGILLTLGVLGAGNWIDFDSGEDDHHHSDVQEPRGAVTAEADEIHRAYRDDPDAAERRFADREMVVSGEFLRIVPDGYGSLDLRLKTSNPDAPLGIDIADIGIEDAKKLVPGQRVTVSCENMGDGGEVLWVRNCVVQAGGDAAAAPAAPAATKREAAPEAPEAPEPPEAPEAP
jgi:hypothetical protein